MRLIKYVAEMPDKEGSAWMVQHYILTLGPWHKSQGYIMRKVRNHPFANKRGYVPEQRLVMEENLGRFLTPRKELVHHLDGDRANNMLSNLKLISPIEHPKGHVGQRNKRGQFIATEPIFEEIKIRLLSTNTGECRPYTLGELIATTYRRGQFKFRGRYTGLKDKNGKEIYEGDIFRQDWKGEQVVGEIVYGDMARFWLKPYEHYFIGEIKCVTGEVIGNIYENPELLEVE